MDNERIETIKDLVEVQEAARRRQTDNQPSGVRYPFTLTRTHVEVAVEKNGGSAEWFKVCGRLEVIANTRDESGRSWGRLVRFQDRDGRVKEVALPMRLFSGDGQECRSQLLDMGLSIESTRIAREALQKYIQSCEPDKFITCVECLGWHTTKSGHSFVLPDEAIGDPSVVVQVDHPIDHAFRSSGTLEEWNENVAKLAIGNSRLALAICSGFAPPLLDVLGLESGGIHVVGMSSVGKTTILIAAGSVWGGGSHGYIKTWRATSNGLEGVAALHNDTLLCLDEIGQIDGREAGEIAYMLANGQGKNRAGRSGHARQAAKWRLLFLSTGELTLADKMIDDGARRAKAGQEVRILNIPADAGQQLGCFENLHGFSTSGAFADAIKSAGGRYFGTAARKFLESIVAYDRSELNKVVKITSCAFIESLGLVGADGQVYRAAARFALLASAGELAIAWGILSWPIGTAIDSMKVCFSAWLDQRGGRRPAEFTKMMRQVRAFFEAHGESRFTKIDKNGNAEEGRSTTYRVGFRRDEDDGVHFFVMPESMWNDVCKGFDKKFVIKTLLERGILEIGENGKASQKCRIPRGGTPNRFYHFLPSVMSAENEDDG